MSPTTRVIYNCKCARRAPRLTKPRPTPKHAYWKDIHDVSELTFVPEGYDANKTAINSALLGRINRWSDSNVLMQQKVTANQVAIDFRMFCNRCKNHKRFRYADFVERGKYENAMASLEHFCKEHKHAEPPVTVTVTFPKAGNQNSGLYTVNNDTYTWSVTNTSVTPIDSVQLYRQNQGGSWLVHEEIVPVVPVVPVQPPPKPIPPPIDPALQMLTDILDNPGRRRIRYRPGGEG